MNSIRGMNRRVAILTLVVCLAMVITIPLFFTSCYAATSSHATVGWVVGNSIDGYGTILRTTDGGNTWERQGSTDDVPNVHLLGVSAVDANTTWVIGGDLTRPNLRFKGVVIGYPNCNNTVGINSVNVILYDVISSDVPEAFLHVGEVVTVTWPISGQFAGKTTFFLETVEVYGSYMEEPMPETWSEVGKAWVSLSTEDHYLNEIKFE